MKVFKNAQWLMRPLVGALMLAAVPFAPTALAAEGHVLNYRDAEIRAFIDDIATITGKTFIIDPRVRGTINVVSTEQVTIEGVFQTFLSALKVNGFTLVPTASGAFKVVPDEVAAQDAGPVDEARKGDLLITQVFTLKYADPLAVQAAIKPFSFKKGRVFARKGTPVVIVTDFADNLERIAKLVATLDIDHSVIRTLALENTSASEMADIAVKLATQPGFDDNVTQSLTALPLDSSNTLVLKGPADVIDTFLPVLKELDANNASRGDLRVVQLSYGTAEKMLPMLEAVTRSMTGREGNAGGDVMISAYSGANAIVINASSEMQQRIANVIHMLDVPRAQVLVEAIVVEVSEGAAKDLGVQYILAGGKSSNIPFTVANYSNTAPNILALTGALQLNDSDGDGTSAKDLASAAAVESLLGFSGFGLGIAGETDGGTIFGAILNALEQDNGSNILSTPSIMAMDNETASFLSGQEIPITTGQTLTSSSTNPFTTIERKDVGVKLEVTPQVNEGEEIHLMIRQEISSIAGTTGANELITNKREIQTTVRVQNGEIVVLGGLIEENESVSVDKVPFLGDIPLLGRAFRSDSKSRSKRNLMIFLRPTIVRSAGDAEALTAKKYNYMRAQQAASETGLSLDLLVEEVMGKGAER
ncbi:type II secretion system secretin GspD [Kordiimonas lipolytica]|uniref:Type II secretion system secretin GspD n=1 Tax=Kordiimonas lipolytica TaxID=1662421 RepID=A0ABV8UA11_9PROT|nr:type II secretion system secretin GspD [Kordiimonas lipolytica]